MTSSADLVPHIMTLKEQVGALQQSFTVAERERGEGRKTQREIKSALNELSSRMSKIPDEDHHEHHEFLKSLIEEHRQRQQLKAEIIKKIATGGAWALVSGLSALLWYSIKNKFGLGE